MYNNFCVVKLNEPFYFFKKKATERHNSALFDYVSKLVTYYSGL